MRDLETSLHTTAIGLAQSFRRLEASKWQHRSVKLARKMKPTFGPQSPAPDNDAALDLEQRLLHGEQSDPPGYLAYIADEALQAAGVFMGGAWTGEQICLAIAEHAGRIAQGFVAVEDLIDVMVEQAQHISGWLERRYCDAGVTVGADPTSGAGFGTAAELAPVVSGLTGVDVSRKHISYLGSSRQVTVYTTPRGTTCYALDDVVRAVMKNTQKGVE